MSSKSACNFDNVMGKMLGLRESDGLLVDGDMLDELDNGGKLNYNEQSNTAGEALFDESTDIKGAKAASGWKDKGVVGLVKRVLTDQAGVSEILGDDLVDEMDDLVRDFAENGGREWEFSEAAASILDQYEDNYSGAKLGYFNEYRDWMTDGGPLFAENRKTGLGQGLANLTDNAIKSSLTVGLGNPIEMAIKLPALYPEEVAQGVSNWISQGHVFKKIPELEKTGFYNLERREITDSNLLEKLNSKWEGINHTLDIPWKNLAYHTGAVRGGMKGGIKAVEDVLFQPRMANMPRQRWASAGRVESRLLNYSINSVKLGVNLMRRAATGDPKAIAGLGIMLGSMTALGGPGALIPKPVEDYLKEVNPDFEPPPKWFAAGLIQQQGISRVGIPFDMVNRQGRKTWESFLQGGEGVAEGDAKKALVNLGFAVGSAYAFTQSWAGDALAQKAFGIGRDLMLDELGAEDLPGEIQDKYLPFLESDD